MPNYTKFRRSWAKGEVSREERRERRGEWRRRSASTRSSNTSNGPKEKNRVVGDLQAVQCGWNIDYERSSKG